ncbi:MAG: hypothetical protein H8E26_03080 [FCB group bacterium]|nr:hypothetical protein [FCB group bacterium]
MSNNPIVCVAWFKSNQWEKLKDVSVDSSGLGATYEEWRSNVNHTIGKMKSGGMIIHKIQIDIDELIEWAETRGVPLDGKARSEYAIHMFAQLDRDEKLDT